MLKQTRGGVRLGTPFGSAMIQLCVKCVHLQPSHAYTPTGPRLRRYYALYETLEEKQSSLADSADRVNGNRAIDLFRTTVKKSASNLAAVYTQPKHVCLSTLVLVRAGLSPSEV